MSEKEINEIVEEHYGFTVEEIDNMVGTLSLKIHQLQERIAKAVECIEHYESIRGYYEYVECGYDEYNYEEDLKEELLEILKGEKE